MRFYITILFLWISISSKSQKNSYEIINNEFSKTITERLSAYEIGSGLSWVLFKRDNRKYTMVKTVSSNHKTKLIIDSIVATRDDFFKLQREKNGYYLLPIIQIMFKEDGALGNDLNWENNNSWQLKTFNDMMFLERTIILRPIVIMNSPDRIN
jgi:hypothetical protein